MAYFSARRDRLGFCLHWNLVAAAMTEEELDRWLTLAAYVVGAVFSVAIILALVYWS